MFWHFTHTSWKVWASTCLQQQNHFILQLWIVRSVTCRLQRRLRCLSFWEAALICSECIALQPQSLLSPHACALPLAASTPRGWSNVYVNASAAAAGRHGSPERSVLSDIYVRLSSLRARTRPICRLGCLPSPSSQQVFCAVLCVTVSARLVLGEVADCFGFTRHTALHNECSKRTCNAEARLKGFPTGWQSAGSRLYPDNVITNILHWL